ncbi:FAD-dependent monooxygenase [Streptomyces tsukubensis]|uniref:Monooxygenase n=1 Tax=Streptomyces tsukubensis TaxID=83656 RepID=A0A1V4A774_9ACTN|nr:FAD-dependent monooxygenase [Streptomyces tsukubensis]OON78083.1 monooxygenase [Streptomyces tsukubensis]QFR98204.1 monooxygenase [Streptomyces tsukubensis]
MVNYQVVIAGGGPVGLWLAGELRRAGVTVAVVEPRTERDPRSRALTLHPRTLETFASRGVHEPYVKEGVPLPGGHFGVLDSRLDFRRLPSPFPHTLALPQERTEAHLEQQALALGADILRGHEVTGFTGGPHDIAVHITGPNGPRTLRAAYLAGCDGARSTVRAAAGIDFPGTPSTVLGWLGDVVLDEPPAAGGSWFGPTGTLMAVPMAGGLHRVVGLVPRDLTTTWPGDLTLEELRENAFAVAGTDFGMRDPIWLSRFGNATRLAAHYREGRVFLAGDAAHQHFPAGGVGMNVGIQDAANLGWKLAAVLNGWAPDALLDTYHAERHPVGVDLTESSRAQVALMTAFTTEGLSLRALFARLITDLPDLNDRLAAQVSSLSVAYPAAGAHPLTGTRAPDLPLEGTGLFALLRADGYLLLDLTGDTGHPLGRFTRPGLSVHSSGTPHPVPADWADVRAALIRPDGHVAWACGEDGAALTGSLTAALATTHLK